MLLVIFAAVLVQAFIPMQSSSASGCPTYWKEYSGNCYRVFTQELTWMDAEYHCQYYSGHLVSLHSSSESEFVRDLWNRDTNSKTVSGKQRYMYWIGLNDRTKDGVFKYSDYSSMDFTNFHSGEPSGGRDQDCIVAWDYQYNKRATWDDDKCDHGFGFICKIPTQQ